MSLSSLIPLAGAAVAPVLGKVIDGVAEGISFLDVLHTQAEDGVDEAGEATDSNTLQQNIAELADRLRERFTQLGIDLSTPLRLKQDGRDRVVVDGDHPDRVLIESIFGNDEELMDLFKGVAQSATDLEEPSDSEITREFRFVLGQSDASIEFV